MKSRILNLRSAITIGVLLCLTVSPSAAQSRFAAPDLYHAWPVEEDFQNTGGVVQAAAYSSLQAAIDATPSNGRLDVAPGSYALSGSLSLPQAIHFHCAGQSAVSIKAPSGGAIFSFPNSHINQLKIDGCSFAGNGSGSSVFKMPGLTIVQGRFIFVDNIVSNFHSTAAALTIGASNYILTVARNYFTNCDTALDVGLDSDGKIDENFFYSYQTASAGAELIIRGVDLRVIHNFFINASDADTTPDILIVPSAAANSGGEGSNLFIEFNKFGNEAETAGTSRYKVQVYAAGQGTYASNNVVFAHNLVFCAGGGGQSAIGLTNGINFWTFEGNIWSTCSCLIDDEFTTSVVGGSSFDESNKIYPYSGSRYQKTTIFSHGGKGQGANNAFAYVWPNQSAPTRFASGVTVWGTTWPEMVWSGYIGVLTGNSNPCAGGCVTFPQNIVVDRVQAGYSRPSGCTTAAVITVEDSFGHSVPLTLANGSYHADSGPISVTFTGGGASEIITTTAAAGCSTPPAAAIVTVMYHAP